MLSQSRKEVHFDIYSDDVEMRFDNGRRTEIKCASNKMLVHSSCCANPPSRACDDVDGDGTSPVLAVKRHV